MAAIERETALLELKAKREKLLSEIENSKASLRRNQLEELERREQITRNRINWEVEQEQAAKRSALEIEQAKREMERQAQIEEEQRADRERQRQREEEEAKRQRDFSPEVNNGVAHNDVSAPEEDISTVYSIEEVHGVGGELSATLVSDNGTINVREGYPLKNGYKVSKITTSFVEVKKNDKVELLRFANGSNMSR
jgi:type IV pilus biogenesis protein PilP